MTFCIAFRFILSGVNNVLSLGRMHNRHKIDSLFDNWKRLRVNQHLKLEEFVLNHQSDRSSTGAD